MQIDILTIFPDMFKGPFSDSIIQRAQDQKTVLIHLHDLRDWSTDNHRSVDDRPYGGGAGMVMRVDIIDRAVNDLLSSSSSSWPTANIEDPGTTSNLEVPSSGSLDRFPMSASSRLENDDRKKTKVVLLDTKGPFYTQQKAEQLSKEDHLIFIAGHYEGLDHRIHEHIVDEVISIGPYVLTGGELPVMVVVDSIVRLLPGVINEESLREESYSSRSSSSSWPSANIGDLRKTSKGSKKINRKSITQQNNSILTIHTMPGSPISAENCRVEDDEEEKSLSALREAPQYTRPADYKGWKVPEILLSGNHKEIEKWREEQKKKY